MTEPNSSELCFLQNFYNIGWTFADFHYFDSLCQVFLGIYCCFFGNWSSLARAWAEFFCCDRIAFNSSNWKLRNGFDWILAGMSGTGPSKGWSWVCFFFVRWARLQLLSAAARSCSRAAGRSSTRRWIRWPASAASAASVSSRSTFRRSSSPWTRRRNCGCRPAPRVRSCSSWRMTGSPTSSCCRPSSTTTSSSSSNIRRQLPVLSRRLLFHMVANEENRVLSDLWWNFSFNLEASNLSKYFEEPRITYGHESRKFGQISFLEMPQLDIFLKKNSIHLSEHWKISRTHPRSIARSKNNGSLVNIESCMEILLKT